MEHSVKEFARLLGIMDELRAKCPWDRQQTFESLRHLTIEETYELSDAIMEKDFDEIKNELGDLMLHIVFYAKIAGEERHFTITDVLTSINEKLIKRHPHIYGEVKVASARDVKDNWEKIKLAEGRKSVLSGVPNALSALVKAYRMQEKAQGVGFDWEKPEQVWDKVNEEMGELIEEINISKDKWKIEEEFGDLLFALVNYARFINVNPEDALEKSNRKFLKRFKYMEKEVEKAGKKLSEMTFEEMDVFWNRAKKMG